MARLAQAAVLLAGAVCVLALVASAHEAPPPKFTVQGQVVCEVCRCNFINKLSEPMAGATVKLECKTKTDAKVTYSLEGVTNAEGLYNLSVEGNHEDEACEITLVKSSRADCSEVLDEGWSKQAADVSIDSNSGQHDAVRKANPLGFTKKNANPECQEFLKTLMPDLD